MRLRKILPLLMLSASFAAAQAGGQQVSGDPNNPNNQMNNVPTLLDHGSGTDQGHEWPTATPADKQFAQMTAQRARLEIELGKLAMERGSAPGVKALAQRTSDDYSKWLAMLERASSRLQIRIPGELDKNRKAVVNRLASLQGSEFDQEYIKEMTNLQNRALTVTQYEAANAGVNGFRNWAGLMMPALEEHMKLTKSALRSDGAVK